MILNRSGETPGNFHVVIENDNVDKAYVQLRDFICSQIDDKPGKD